MNAAAPPPAPRSALRPVGASPPASPAARDSLPGERIPSVIALLLCVLGVYLAMTAIGRLNDFGQGDASEEVAP